MPPGPTTVSSKREPRRTLDSVDCSDKSCGSSNAAPASNANEKRRLETNECGPRASAAAASSHASPRTSSNRAHGWLRRPQTGHMSVVHARDSTAPMMNVSRAHADLRGPRNAGGGSRADQKVAGPDRHRKSRASRQQSDHNVLRHDLSNDSRTAGAERETRGEFVSPFERLADEQARRRCRRPPAAAPALRPSGIERRPGVARQLLEQACDRRTGPAIGVWVFGCERVCEHVEFGPRLFDR